MGNGRRTKAPTKAAESSANPPQSAKEFFSRLDWQAADSGYTGFPGESESDSDDESSSSSEEEMNQGMFGGTHTHTVSVWLELCAL